jgi:hypothetical protein
MAPEASLTGTERATLAHKMRLALVKGWGASVVVLVLGCGGSGNDDLFGGSSGGEGGAGGSGNSSATGGTGGASASGGVGGTSTGGSGGVSGSSSGGSGGSGVDGGDGAAGCDFDGAWAGFVTTPVTWPETNVLAPGSDKLQVWVLTKRKLVGNTSNDTGRLCGIVLPPFQTKPIFGTVEKYGLRFLADAFDGMPEFTIPANIHGIEPGDSFATMPAAIVFGITMQTPESDPWPPLSGTSPADHDGDGNPGVTTQTEKGPGFSGPPLGLTLPIQRADKLFIASRTVVQLTGIAQSCDELVGQVTVNQIEGSPAINSHRVGCIKQNGQYCTQSENAFIDENGPLFQPAPGSTLVQRRVPDDTTCAQVRGMFPAQ